MKQLKAVLCDLLHKTAIQTALPLMYVTLLILSKKLIFTARRYA